MITHNGTKRIETDRLILRRFTVNDAEMAFHNWTNDPEVSKYLTWTPHGNIINTIKIFDMWSDDYNNLDNYNWGIVQKDTGVIFGSIAVVEINEKADSATIGYCIGKEWWGKGYMTEAFSAVIKCLFEDCGFNSIRACHHAENPASGKVMAKCGLKQEGVLRSFTTDNLGKIVDLVSYSILKSEYEYK